jgi:hypothetical protein
MLAALLSACTMPLISGYDEVTDKTVTALQRKVEEHLVRLEAVSGKIGCEHAKYEKFYEEVKVDVSAIRTRTDAIPKNDITIKQTNELSESLQGLEDLHKLACISKAQIPTLRAPLNSIFTGILKLELAKKRGQ